jgi:hypothetical protein
MVIASSAVLDAITQVDAPFGRKFTAPNTILVYPGPTYLGLA